MKQDLDALMEQYDVDVVWVTGPSTGNPAMVYFTGGAPLTAAELIKRRGQPPVLLHRPMERDEAAHTGLALLNADRYPYRELIEEAGGDLLRYQVLRYRRLLADLDISSGRVALYGRIDAGQALSVFNSLRQDLPQITFVSEGVNSVLSRAMLTKDAAEVERIRGIGKVTTTVVGKTADFLSAQQARDGLLVDRKGEPVTIGQVKQHINLWLAELGAENPKGTVFASGYDSAVPHSTGTDQSPLRLGETIVFDIFPCESGGGYFYDFTRTWCLGYAPDEVQSLYDDVHGVFRQLLSELKANAPCKAYQQRTCELFEALGHPTVRTDPKTEDGYVHAISHGLGLQVHEAPWFGENATPADVLAPGVVFTVEPGLYYPGSKMGIRLEDTLWMKPDGQAEVLSGYPYDLVLPVRRQTRRRRSLAAAEQTPAKSRQPGQDRIQ
jgi:Xaa-Pro aminopeptidase